MQVERIQRVPVWVITLVALIFLPYAVGHAIVLTFDFNFFNYDPVPQTYGDRVTSLLQGTFTYGSGGGFTPNVKVGYGPVPDDVHLWHDNYGDLHNVIYREAEGAGILVVTLSADPGFQVTLDAFDVAGWSAMDYTINSVKVLDGNGALLFARTNVFIDGDSSGPRHTRVAFSPALVASVLKIRVDSQNLGSSSDNIGLDNIRFGQRVDVKPMSPRVVIIDVDGLRADVVREAFQQLQDYPGLHALFGSNQRSRASLYTNAWTIFPSVTLVGHASIFTGTYPGKHGVLGNSWFDRTLKTPNPYPCTQNKLFGFDTEIDNGIINYLCPSEGPTARAGICAISPFATLDVASVPVFVVNKRCRQPIEGLANAHLKVPTVYKRLSDAGLTSAVNFNHYWQGATLRFAPDLAEVGIYLCAYTNNPLLLEPIFNCPEGVGKKLDFAAYDATGLFLLIDALQRGTAYHLFTFYFAGVDGYCHHMQEEVPPFDVKACQRKYIRQLLDAQFLSIAKALNNSDPEWREHTLVILTADHGMTTTASASINLKEQVSDVLENSFCLGDCDGNLQDRDVVLADNGGMAHIYVRNRHTSTWDDVPRWNDIHKAALTLSRNTTLWPLISIYVRDVRSGRGWNSEYQRFTYNPQTKTWYLEPLTGRTGLLIQNLRSIWSGDVLVVLKPGLYFDDLSEYPSNHGGLSPHDLKIPLVIAGPNIEPGENAKQVSNTQIVATAYRFLTGNDLSPDEVEPHLPDIFD